MPHFHERSQCCHVLLYPSDDSSSASVYLWQRPALFSQPLSFHGPNLWLGAAATGLKLNYGNICSVHCSSALSIDSVHPLFPVQPLILISWTHDTVSKCFMHAFHTPALCQILNSGRWRFSAGCEVLFKWQGHRDQACLLLALCFPPPVTPPPPQRTWSKRACFVFL